MGALIGGIIALVIGIAGIVRWTWQLVIFLKGSVPLMICFGGLLAVIAGITSIKDAAEAKKLEKEAEEKKEENKN